MNVFTKSISLVFRGAMKSFQTFPAAIGSALAFAIVTMIRIQLDWPEQEAYNFLFNCLHWSFALGAIFSLAAITAEQSRSNRRRSFWAANLIGVAVVILTFASLYWLDGTHTNVETYRYAMISGLAMARVSVCMLVSFLAFIYFASYPKEQSDFSQAFFMTHKAFFVTALYGVVLMAGTSSIAGAIQALLYHDMSSKVYMYLGTLVGFLTFTMFLGYFPDFRKGEGAERREIVQKQPRFIEILLGSILVPIVLVLTAVLLIWEGKTVITGMGTSFEQLAGIATAYTLGGLWLHIMVTHYEAGLAKFYRLIYPITALILLIVEAWALVVQLGKSGLKLTEYNFGLIWILAFVAVLLLIIRKAKAHVPIIMVLCVLAIFAVLPVVGYQALPVRAQVDRLENLLIGQKMLADNQIVPAAKEPKLSVRESITDAVNYLAYAQDAVLPAWFDTKLANQDVFLKKFGFEQVWPKPDNSVIGQQDYLWTSLILSNGAIDVSDYRWAVAMQEGYEKYPVGITVQGEKGVYEFSWSLETKTGMPTLVVSKDNKVILEKDMKDYIDRISEAYPPDANGQKKVALEDMSVSFDTPEMRILLVFRNVEINLDVRQDTMSYGFGVQGLYFQEK